MSAPIATVLGFNHCGQALLESFGDFDENCVVRPWRRHTVLNRKSGTVRHIRNIVGSTSGAYAVKIDVTPDVNVTSKLKHVCPGPLSPKWRNPVTFVCPFFKVHLHLLHHNFYMSVSCVALTIVLSCDVSAYG